MDKMIQESLVNYHNQLFGETIESKFIGDNVQEISDLAYCQNNENHSGYCLEFDVKDYKIDDIKIDVFNDVMRITADSSDNNIAKFGTEFGLHQVIQLPPGSDVNMVSAHINNETLKVWIPRE